MKFVHGFICKLIFYVLVCFASRQLARQTNDGDRSKWMGEGVWPQQRINIHVEFQLSGYIAGSLWRWRLGFGREDLMQVAL